VAARAPCQNQSGAAAKLTAERKAYSELEMLSPIWVGFKIEGFLHAHKNATKH